MLQFLSIIGRIGAQAARGGHIGKLLEEALGEDFEKSEKEDPIKAAEKIRDLIRGHFSRRFPGSKHFDPDKVNSTRGLVIVDVPGVTRAYQDIDIYPKNAAFLTIPVHPDAKGRSASDFSNLFKPKDHNILAANENGALVVYYALSEHVHQKRDPSIMPSDQKIAEVGGAEFAKRFD